MRMSVRYELITGVSGISSMTTNAGPLTLSTSDRNVWTFLGRCRGGQHNRGLRHHGAQPRDVLRGLVIRARNNGTAMAPALIAAKNPAT